MSREAPADGWDCCMVSESTMLLSDRYEIGRLLGRGGMAEVYLAKDRRLNRTVAVKVLRSELAQDEHFQERFRREAQSVGGLNHPAIVAVYDTGEDHRTEPNGTAVAIPYIVMEYVEGETLRAFINEDDPMDVNRASEIMVGVLSALEYSHRAGIVHRDIKPGNIMITPSGAVKVMDFGIARAVAEATSAMTQTQAVMGTAQYLSPEQARGQQVDARSDVYSAAVVLYEMLTGRPPFQGDSPVSIAYQHVREHPEPPSTFNPAIPASMDAVILKGLAKDREQRYQGALEFSRDIAAVVAGRQPTALAAGGAAAAGMAAAGAGDLDETRLITSPDQPTELLSNTQLIPTTGPGAAMAMNQGPSTQQQGAVMPSEPGDLEEDEKRDRTPVALWVLVGLAVLAVAALGLWWLLSGLGNKEPETVAVPGIIGVSESEASSTLQAAGLQGKFEQKPSADVPKGQVFSVSPEVGTQVPVNSTVTVAVSTGPAETTVPDLTGKTRTEAEQLLTDAGLTLRSMGTEDVSGAKAGTVTRTEPGSGATLKQGDEVQVWFASGKVEVPALTGLKREEAEQTLEDLGLQAEVSERADGQAEPGTVLEQSPTSGQTVDSGSTVRVVVAKKEGPVALPNVTGQTADEAQKTLSDAGFGVVRKPEASDSVEKDRVITTDPGPNSRVEPRSTVTIIVSTGPEKPKPTSPPPTTPEPSDTPEEDANGLAPGNSGDHRNDGWYRLGTGRHGDD